MHIEHLSNGDQDQTDTCTVCLLLPVGPIMQAAGRCDSGAGALLCSTSRPSYIIQPDLQTQLLHDPHPINSLFANLSRYFSTIHDSLILHLTFCGSPL